MPSTARRHRMSPATRMAWMDLPATAPLRESAAPPEQRATLAVGRGPAGPIDSVSEGRRVPSPTNSSREELGHHRRRDMQVMRTALAAAKAARLQFPVY